MVARLLRQDGENEWAAHGRWVETRDHVYPTLGCGV